MRYFFTQASLIVLVVLLSAGTMLAQFTVSGKVTDTNGQPLVSVSIAVKGTAIGTITDVDGKYSISIPGNSAVLEFFYVGYVSQQIPVSPDTKTLDVVMEEEAVQLDAVVVSGLASNVKRSNLANAVAYIPSKEISGIAVPATTDAALYGKFKGATITANSGAPGGGIGINLRGITSISGSSQPLIIVDGVYMDNSSIPAGLNIVSKAAGGGSQSNQDNPSNRLADLDPSDIESIEVLKGASTAAIYGSRASGGVIIITTKKGKAGKTRVHFSQSVGQAKILNPLGVREFTEDKVLNSSRFAGDIDLFREARDNGQLHNYEDLLYGNKGLLLNTRLSLNGGTDKTQFFLGFSNKNEEGIVENTGYKKTSVRLNLNHQIAKWLKLQTTTNYIHSSADRGFFNNDNSGTTMGISFSATPSWAQLLPDENGNYPDNPYAPSNFLETAAKVTNNEAVDRILAGGTLTANLYQTDRTALNFIVRGGIDNYTLATTAIFPNTVQFQRNGNGLNGVSVQGVTRNLNTNLAAFLVLSNYLESGMSFRTQLGVTRESFNLNNILGTAWDMNGTQTNLDQSGSRDISQFRLLQEDQGFFVQEEVNYKDMVLLTLGMRGDRSTNNGDVNKLYYYPKAALAINLHEMGNWPEMLSQTKLRVAYGQSGNFARFGSKYTSFSGTIVSGSPGIQISSLLGNSTVGPERQKELEMGFDLGLMDNHILLDFTYYIKNVDDLLLNADVPTSSGFTSKVTNAAALQNKGMEIGLSANIIRTEDVNWNARVGYWTNDAKVTRLDVPAFTTGGFADFLGQFLVKEGYSPTTIIGVGPADYDANGDGIPDTVSVTEGVNRIIFGDAEPDFQMSFYNDFQYKDFTFTFLLHWKKGGYNINLSTLLFDLNETTHDYDDTTLDPDGQLTNGDYRLSLLGVNTQPYIEDASYLALREIGAYYTLPKNAFGGVARVKVGVSGNNLIKLFKYNSYDPEVSNFGSNGLSRGVEVLPFPSSKRLDFHLSVDF
ncbi:MAG TPA: SusC/RagA family TonB-linked outer membrane protein [Phaeodactylibacter sp.]|nr:SusC/RagA family TonB-linked outer membrane protein [Phaeodactylibacter sp.]